MDLTALAPDYVRAIAPYQPGKPIGELAREMGLAEASIVKLASNENPLGLPPKARAALEAAVADLARYPDGNGFALKDRIAERFAVGTTPSCWATAPMTFWSWWRAPSSRPVILAVYSEYAFAVYPLAIQSVGAERIEVKAREYGHDLDAMLAAIRPDTKLVFVANPNNPTGTLLKLAHFWSPSRCLSGCW